MSALSVPKFTVGQNPKVQALESLLSIKQDIGVELTQEQQQAAESYIEGSKRIVAVQEKVINTKIAKAFAAESEVRDEKLAAIQSETGAPDKKEVMLNIIETQLLMHKHAKNKDAQKVLAMMQQMNTSALHQLEVVDEAKSILETVTAIKAQIKGVAIGAPKAVAKVQKMAAQRCDQCGKDPITSSDVTLKKCGRCMTAMYCSQGCQKAHWPTHKQVCRITDNKTPS